MEKELAYQKPWCTVFYLPALKVVGLEWKGFATSKQFREACDASLDLLIQKKAALMLADNRQAKVVLVEDQKWMNEVWFPKAYDVGYRGSAVLVGTDLFRDVAVKNIVHDMEDGKFMVQFFDSEEEAHNWLASLHVAHEEEK
ncbi:MAG: hypothetical protein ACFCUI_09895 [Bernardetiaceae bacterium]